MKSSDVVVCGDNKLFLQISGSCQRADFTVFTHFSSASSHFLFFCKLCRKKLSGRKASQVISTHDASVSHNRRRNRCCTLRDRQMV